MRNKLTALLIMATLLMTTIVSASPTVVVAKNPYKDPHKAFNYVYGIVVKNNVNEDWAEYLLAKYYQHGYGTKADIQKAYVWYKMSATNKYQPSIDAFKSLEKSMSKNQLRKADIEYKKTNDAMVAKFMKDMKSMN